jgi:anti-sigma-K factor RskA
MSAVARAESRLADLDELYARIAPWASAQFLAHLRAERREIERRIAESRRAAA